MSKGILEAIDMDSYRVEKRIVVKIQLPVANAEIEPMPATGGGYTPEPELDRLSNIRRRSTSGSGISRGAMRTACTS